MELRLAAIHENTPAPFGARRRKAGPGDVTIVCTAPGIRAGTFRCARQTFASALGKVKDLQPADGLSLGFAALGGLYLIAAAAIAIARTFRRDRIALS